eukprot:CAMPEP_0204118330 /NCGR_PEP_ID=MMETSP0361-20130328/6483_1 /ASSEMBLY_ACC=CAM_ASM_000343 /TAXON_ID=268821 /ORGANISM="Scrippsiella Hangoei, Strain SHTV-5" /LENGTH=38 /DNA_ID= /DNA_START= /DNA_END= /DNA_ORIENTATION=
MQATARNMRHAQLAKSVEGQNLRGHQQPRRDVWRVQTT